MAEDGRPHAERTVGSGLEGTVPYVLARSHPLYEQNGVLGKLEWEKNKRLADLIRVRGRVAEHGIQKVAAHIPEVQEGMRAMHKVHLNVLTASAAAGINIGEGPFTAATRMLRDYISQMDGAPQPLVHPDIIQGLNQKYEPGIAKLYAHMEALLSHSAGKLTGAGANSDVCKLGEPGIVVPLAYADRRAQLNIAPLQEELDPGISSLVLDRLPEFEEEMKLIYGKMVKGTTPRAVTDIPIAHMDFVKITPRMSYRLPGDGFFEYSTTGGELRLRGLRFYDPRSLVGLYHFNSAVAGTSIQELDGHIYRTIAGMEQSDKDQILA